MARNKVLVEDLATLLRKMTEMHGRGEFSSLIHYVRFPRYRNLEDDARLNLDFPITALVGPNGSGKTSLLHALYGCPGSSNVGNFWFSTELDPIEEGEGRPNCLIYGYQIPETGRIVEVLKTRVTREGNPNYWEPSRPIASYGMELRPRYSASETPYRTQTRWRTINKKVQYIDFRRTISAYDRYFWMGGPIDPAGLESRKSIIRRKAPHIAFAIRKGKKSHVHYQIERIHGNEKVSAESVSAIGFILGRPYTAATVLNHSYYGDPGPTVLLERPLSSYSDAFAGSGETAVILTVLRVMNADPGSLILLDEPEVSLHPGAQMRLLRFLLAQAIAKCHQIVFTTHSPHLIGDLPPKAVKIIQETANGRFDIGTIDSVRSAFYALEHQPSQDASILVEDVLSAEIIKAAFRELGVVPGSSTAPAIHVVPGGSGACLKHIFPSQFIANSPSYLLLDGDVFKGQDIPSEAALAGLTTEELKDVQLKFAGVTGTLPADGGNDLNARTKAENNLRDYLKFCRARVGFLPGGTPESLLFEALNPGVQQPKDVKNWFLEKVRIALGRHPDEILSSVEIATMQKSFVATVLNQQKRPSWWDQVLNISHQILEKKPLRPDLEFKTSPSGGVLIEETL